jgi:hypothetical protein
MPRKRQIVALIDADLADRYEILRVARSASRARVIEDALRERIELHEQIHEETIGRVHALAERAGMTPGEYAAAYAKVYAGLSAALPTLEQLEADDRAVTGKKAKPRPLAR